MEIDTGTQRQMETKWMAKTRGHVENVESE